MKAKPHEPLSADALKGWKYLRFLDPLLQRLHDSGTQRDRAGNRSLHFDQYCALVLLMLFNPMIRSLRSIQRASKLKKVQRKLGCPRTSLGSLSESVTVFDPERLKGIIAELSPQLQAVHHDDRLKDLRGTLTLVDATLVNALPSMTEASLLKCQTGSARVKWRLHTHFEVDRHIPSRIDVTEAGGGEADERAVLERTIEPDHLYVMDRGYAKFALFNRIVVAGSSYVCRIRDNSNYDVIEETPLSAAAVAQRVLQDAQVTIGKSSKNGAKPDHTIRVVTIAIKPHREKGLPRRLSHQGSTGAASDGVLRLATNLLDVPAEIIALIYFYRWTIEIFFRFLKQLLGCRHLISYSQNGIEIQTYCAIIACMLLSLWTGKKPTLRTYEMICFYFMGLADEQEVLEHIAELKDQHK
jgi:Transposase DDE domain